MYFVFFETVIDVGGIILAYVTVNTKFMKTVKLDRKDRLSDEWIYFRYYIIFSFVT